MRSIQEELKGAVNKEMRDNGGWQAGCTWEIEVDAAIDAFFASEWEAKEVDYFNREGRTVERWFAQNNVPYDDPRGLEEMTILVPRKKPGLREAAVDAERLLRRVSRYVPSVGDVHEAGDIADALAAALKEEDK